MGLAIQRPGPQSLDVSRKVWHKMRGSFKLHDGVAQPGLHVGQDNRGQETRQRHAKEELEEHLACCRSLLSGERAHWRIPFLIGCGEWSRVLLALEETKKEPIRNSMGS